MKSGSCDRLLDADMNSSSKMLQQAEKSQNMLQWLRKDNSPGKSAQRSFKLPAAMHKNYNSSSLISHDRVALNARKSLNEA